MLISLFTNTIQIRSLFLSDYILRFYIKSSNIKSQWVETSLFGLKYFTKHGLEVQKLKKEVRVETMVQLTIEIFRFALFFLCLKVNNGLPKCIVHYIKDAVDKEMMQKATRNENSTDRAHISQENPRRHKTQTDKSAPSSFLNSEAMYLSLV